MELQSKTTITTRNKLYIIPVVAVCSLLFFFLLANLMETGKISPLDETVSEFFQLHVTGGLYEFIAFITNLGSKYVVISIALFTLAIMWWKTKDYIGMITVAGVLIGSDQLYKILKLNYHRERPIYDPSIDAVGYSFPSGHATVSMAFYGIIIYFVWKYMKQSTMKTMAIYSLGTYIFIMGMTRVLLRAHYLSDVLAGFAIAFTYLSIWIFLYNLITTFVMSRRSQKDISM